jgi:hypothetical protein
MLLVHTRNELKSNTGININTSINIICQVESSLHGWLS